MEYSEIANRFVERQREIIDSEADDYNHYETGKSWFIIIDTDNHLRYTDESSIFDLPDIAYRIVVIEKLIYNEIYHNATEYRSFTINELGDAHDNLVFNGWNVHLLENYATKQKMRIDFNQVNEDHIIQFQHIIDTILGLKDLSTVEEVEAFKEKYYKEDEDSKRLLEDAASKDEQIRILKAKVAQYEDMLQQLRKIVNMQK